MAAVVKEQTTIVHYEHLGDVRISVTPIGEQTIADRGRRGPVRSRLRGLAWIMASPFVALAFVAVGEWAHEASRRPGFFAYGVVFGLLAGVGCVKRGLRMRLRDGWEVLRRDRRPPVIFLRPFSEDERIHHKSPVGAHLGAEVPTSKSERKATAEPKIGRTLRSIGPFVAVGKPGERLAPFGAARLYLDDHEWQDIVAFLIVHAMAVVLQPDDSPGAVWELKAAVQHVDPRRILMLVPNSGLRPLGFVRIRWLTGQVLPVPLPEDVACDAFMFDEHWVPRGLQFGKKPQLALRAFVEQVRQLTFPQEKRDAFAAFIGAIRR